MADQTLKDKFFNAFKASKLFSRMTPEQQNELLTAYADADDAKFMMATRALSDIEAELGKPAPAPTSPEVALAEAKAINVALAELKKLDRKEHEEAEQEQTQSDADDLLKSIGQAGDQPKRKKLFGLF